MGRSTLLASAWSGRSSQSHGMRNQVTPWRELAPQPLSFTPREKAVMDTVGLHNALLEKDGPLDFPQAEHVSIVERWTSSHRFLW
jgi:hypothetical protein